MPQPAFRKSLLPRALRHHAGHWRALRTPEDLAVLLRIPQHTLALHSLKPGYKEYHIPKRNGGRRLIEDPAPDLKKALRRINHFLQACYLDLRPACVHGFTRSPKRAPPRNILSNARAHLRQDHLFNLDLDDFFHHVSQGRVERIHRRHFPAMQDPLVEMLGRICTRQGRLPMGAPTSPALSNYACLGMDADLEALARNCGWTFTRFADDLSFSGETPFTETQEELIRSAIRQHGFRVAEEKVRRYGPGEDKVVTGLHLWDGEIELPPDYLPLLSEEIQRLHAVMLVEGRYQTGMSMRKLRLLQQELAGKINFASQVLGPGDERVRAKALQYEDALHARANYESASWLDLPYTAIDI